jgi:predicted deacetylase
VSARYLIRLDDACDTMDRNKWELFEAVLDRYEVKPIVAVVPDNQDSELMFAGRDPQFWHTVRKWAAKGWTVAMHGYKHLMHRTDSTLLVPYYRRSEFAGLSLEAQTLKIRSAWQLFLAQGVVPEVWVAPAHSFDVVTLKAISAETSIRVVSDGIAWNSYHEHGFHWIPQQLWGLAERGWGLWTVCLHPNQMTEQSIADFDAAMSRGFQRQIIRFTDIRLRSSRKTLLERLYHEYFWWRWRTLARRLQ